jgi:hypothetical protein
MVPIYLRTDPQPAAQRLLGHHSDPKSREEHSLSEVNRLIWQLVDFGCLTGTENPSNSRQVLL